MADTDMGTKRLMASLALIRSVENKGVSGPQIYRRRYGSHQFTAGHFHSAFVAWRDMVCTARQTHAGDNGSRWGPIRPRPPGSAELTCGGTRFVLTNIYDPAAFIASQVLVSRRGEDPVFQVDLRIRRHGDGAGPFGFVSDWLCHRGHRGVFLELLYGCNSYMTKTAIDRYCGGDQTAQWGRYIGLDGQPLDRGYRIGDPRYRELDRRLGLSDPRTEPMLQAD